VTVTAYLSLGSNIGERKAQLEKALHFLEDEESIELLHVSSFYETKPVGVTDQPDFLNMAAAIRTSLSPENLLHVTQSIEKKLGRQRKEKWGPRTIDIDILLYAEEQINLASLIVPHPRLQERAFVLVPLEEIAPELEIAGRPLKEITAELEDAKDVRRID
jgi:2-amino-4-hydroxy-6-hydroxymethyldihydropteridine diphosphokinase